jgi:hypothetical protein
MSGECELPGEREAAYAGAAEMRIAAVEPLAAPTLAQFMTTREAPRVPFAALIDRGLVTPGAHLSDPGGHEDAAGGQGLPEVSRRPSGTAARIRGYSRNRRALRLAYPCPKSK